MDYIVPNSFTNLQHLRKLFFEKGNIVGCEVIDFDNYWINAGRYSSFQFSKINIRARCRAL